MNRVAPSPQSSAIPPARPVCPSPRTGRRRRGRRLLPRTAAGTLAILAGFSTGCEWKSFLDPSELVDPDESTQLSADGTARPRVQTILTELNLGLERPEDAFTSARDVQARDLELMIEDYQIAPRDLLRVTIVNYPDIGQSLVEGFTVSETGKISLPDVGQITVVGRTEDEVKSLIEDAYRQAGILVDPPVSVMVVEAYGRVFSLMGAVATPGRYQLLKSDFRMFDALSLAGGVGDYRSASEYAYIIRSPEEPQPQGDHAQPGPDDNGAGDDPLAPRSRTDEPVAPTEWGGPTFATAAAVQPDEGDFQFQVPEAPAGMEIIRVPLRELMGGALQYNVVIHPDDTIIIPNPDSGFYFVGGHVNTPGTYQIMPDGDVTVKQAIVAARGLDLVAIPSRTQLIRRVGDQDVFVRINLAKIFTGQEPDMYLQPDDMIMVGTNFPAPFLAALRNGFRVTYGFGFLYDRNFAAEQNNQGIND